MSDRWQQVGQLFDQALTAAPDEREAILTASHAPDDIKEEVRSLLQAHDAAGGFLESRQPVSLVEAAPLAPGATVGAYRIIRVLGRGGMGVVYEAEDARLGRRVALKALSPDVAHDDQRRRRLRHEARAAAALQHPGIATIYALEELDDELFISSELLQGETLRDELERGVCGPQRAASDAIDIARALCAAHERGIVHRDLKPENIMRTTEGALKILDFGVAQFEPRTADLQRKSRLTLAGMLAGTPAYMAPEQLLGAATDFRADQFALGILVYELCTGRHPFTAASLPATVARILAAAPEAPMPPAAIPTALWQVVERCLQKDPAHRFASTRDLLRALERAAAQPDAVALVSPTLASEPTPAKAALSGPVRWWRFHQLAAALAYWAMVWPVWHIHRSLGRAGLFFFFAVLASVVVAANLRLHLWFSSRVYPEDLPAQRAEVSRWIRWADVAFVALLIAGGIALPDDRAGWAALLISFGVGTAVVFTFVEPATTRAAFRHLVSRLNTTP